MISYTRDGYPVASSYRAYRPYRFYFSRRTSALSISESFGRWNLKLIG